jgi:hypothetical protein
MAPQNPPLNTTTITTPNPSSSPSNTSPLTNSTTTPPPTAPDRQAQYRQVIHYTSISALLLCPTLILLPPRKLDIYTVLLLSSTGLAGNQLVREYTGRSIAERLREMGREGAEERRSRKEKAVLVRERGGGDMSKMVAATARRGDGDGEGGAEKTVGPTTAAVLRAGREREDWKARRDAREKEALEDGKGYGGLITDQIWEVWNWGRESKGEGSGEVAEGKKDGKR